MKILKTFYSREFVNGSESLHILIEEGKLYKVRFQWDAGTGHDDIWLNPGETQQGYFFPLSEANEYRHLLPKKEPVLFLLKMYTADEVDIIEKFGLEKSDLLTEDQLRELLEKIGMLIFKPTEANFFEEAKQILFTSK